jgi:hypothetical protein
MDPQKGSITSVRKAAPRRWVAHLPLGFVIGLGALVMAASEEPEAARAEHGRVATGEIITTGASKALVAPKTVGARPTKNSTFDPDLPGTLTDLGDVPEASRILGYRDALELMTLSPDEQALSDLYKPPVQSPVRATAGLAELRHSFEQRLRDQQMHSDSVTVVSLDPSLEAQAKIESPPIIKYRDDSRVREERIARFLSRFYRRSESKIRQYIRFAHESAERNGVDPLLIVGIMCVESSLNPKATSHKDAKGLMQVLVAAHTKRFKPFGGTKNAYDPRTSIEVGTRIIGGMIARTGSVKGGLKHYVGAANFRTDGGYGDKVIGMRDRVWAAAVGQRIPAKPNMAKAIARAEKAQAKLKLTVLAASAKF